MKQGLRSPHYSGSLSGSRGSGQSTSTWTPRGWQGRRRSCSGGGLCPRTRCSASVRAGRAAASAVPSGARDLRRAQQPINGGAHNPLDVAGFSALLSLMAGCAEAKMATDDDDDRKGKDST